MTLDIFSIVDYNEDYLYYLINTKSGLSGAPLLLFTDKLGYQVIGIHIEKVNNIYL